MTSKRMLILAAIALMALPLAAISAEQSDTFKLQKVSIFDYDGTYKPMLTNGQYVQASADTPDPQVKAYPPFKSQKPLYGTLRVNRSYANLQGTAYYFAIDESAGTGKGYDLLYFDADHNLDLTDNAPLTALKDLPEKLKELPIAKTATALFQPVRFKISYGDASPPWPVELTAVLQQQSNYTFVNFIFPEARTGKVKLGDKQVNLLLSQSMTITGRWDQPMVYVFTEDTPEPTMMLCSWRILDGAFYSFEVPPEGDSIRIARYKGDMGLFSGGHCGKLERGWLQDSQGRIVDTTKCETQDGELKLPVGDYRPIQIVLKNDKVRLALAAEMDQTGSPSKPAYPLAIRKAAAFELRIGSDPQVVFTSPADEQTIKPGDQLNLKAVVRDKELHCLVAGLQDATKKAGDPIKMADGVEYQQYESLDPQIRILDSAGKTLAEGKMPFG